MIVLLRKGLNLKMWSVFLDPEGNSVVLDANDNVDGAFRLVTEYAPTEAKQQTLGGLSRDVSLFSVSRQLERHFGCTCA